MPARLLSPLRSPFAPGRRVFNPATLFAGGQAGFYFDPLDPTTAYQDSAGTTAGVVAQPLGMRLDKRLGSVLGPELVANGTFDSDVSGWSALAGATVSWADGELRITSTGVGAGGASLVLSGLTVGQRYVLRATGRRGTTTGVVVADMAGIANANTNATTSNAQVGYSFVASAVSHTLQLYMNGAGGAGQTAFFDNISLRPLPGNHSTQSTSPSRPVWAQDASGFYRDTFDGFDDSLTIAAGGGSTTGFFYCGAVNVAGGAGAIREIFDDRNGTAGYVLLVNATNQLAFNAGNGTAFTTVTTVATLPAGAEKHVVTAWDDGVNLNAQIDSGAVASIARPVVAAGTGSISEGKHNALASQFFNGSLYARVYRAGPPPSAAQIAQVQRFIASRAGVTL